MQERIQKVLARCNIASRRKVEEMILEGRVRVNGKKLTTLGVSIDPDKDRVHVNGTLIHTSSDFEQEKIYLLLRQCGQYLR